MTVLKPNMWVLEKRENQETNQPLLQYFVQPDIASVLAFIWEETTDMHLTLEKVPTGNFQVVSKKEEQTQYWIGTEVTESNLEKLQNKLNRFQENASSQLHSVSFPSDFPVTKINIEDFSLIKTMFRERSYREQAIVIFIYWDEEQNPLYVGLTSDFRTAFASHRKNDFLWARTASVGLIIEKEREEDRFRTKTHARAKKKESYLRSIWDTPFNKVKPKPQGFDEELWELVEMTLIPKYELLKMLQKGNDIGGKSE